LSATRSSASRLHTGKPLTELKRTWVCRKAGLGAEVPLLDAKGKPVLDRKGNPRTEFQPNAQIHDIRHSFASILVSAGASLPLIGQMLGHTQVQPTQRYAHLSTIRCARPPRRWAPSCCSARPIRSPRRRPSANDKTGR